MYRNTDKIEDEVDTRISILKLSLNNLNNFIQSENADTEYLSARIGEEEKELEEYKKKYPEYFV